MSQPIFFKDILSMIASKLIETLETDDYADKEYFLDVDIKYPYEMKGKTKNFPVCPASSKKKQG